MKQIEGKGENWFLFRCPGEGPAESVSVGGTGAVLRVY